MKNVVFSPRIRSSIRIWGLIGAGTLAGIEIIWYILTYFWLGGLVYSPVDVQVVNMSISNFYIYLFLADVLFACLPVLAALPVFFWIGQQAAQRIGLMRAGTQAALQAYGWWIIIKAVLFSFLLYFFFTNFWIFTIKLLLFYLASFVLAVLLMFGVSWWMGTLGGRSARSQSSMPVEDSSPQPLSALEILQQRFARGEIDSATFQQMCAQLETSTNSYPNPHQ